MTLSYAREQTPNFRHKISVLLDRLTIDYVVLRSTMPTPATRGARTAPRGSREYGHPAQWASDHAKAIADCLDATSEALRDHLGHLPPPPRTRAETRVVNHAYNTIKVRLDDIHQFPGLEAFLNEARELHAITRRILGLTQQRQALALPCPNCSQIPVFRTVYDDRRDTIECHHCGYEIKEQEYGLYARILVDELLNAADETPTVDNAT